MSNLKIKDAPLLPALLGSEKIPTGGRGNFTTSADQLKEYIAKDLQVNVDAEVSRLDAVDATLDTRIYSNALDISQNTGRITTVEAKVSTVAIGATANATNEQLRDRTTHTGVQPISSVSNLQTELNNRSLVGHTHTQQQVEGLATRLGGIETSIDQVETSIDAESQARIDFENRRDNPHEVTATQLSTTTSGVSQQEFNDATCILAPIKASNTWQQNRDIVQAANDSLVVNGGGIIQLPSGNFEIKGVILGGGITVKGNNTTLTHPDGFDVDMFATQTYSTTASATANTYTITVADATGIKVNSLIALEAGRGLDIYQSTTIVSSVDAVSTTGFQLTDKTGFQTYALGIGALIIGTEAIFYSSMDASGNLSGVVRGWLGTTATSHAAGAQIGIAARLVTEVASIAGNVLTVKDKVNFSVSGTANLLAGTFNTKVLDITVEGQRQNNVGGHRWSPFRLTLHRFGEANYTVRNSENGCYLQTSSLNLIRINGYDVSKTGTAKIGAAVWLYQGSDNNEIHLSLSGDCWCGVVLDDRSTFGTEYSAPCNGNFGTISGRFNNYDPVTPLNTTLLNLTAGVGNNFKVRAFGVYAPVFVADDAQGISNVGAYRKAEGNFADVFADTCINPVSALNCKNNAFYIHGINAGNLKPLVAEGNFIGYSNFNSINGASLKMLDGGFAAPSYGFINQTSTGMSLASNGWLTLYKDAVAMLQIDANTVYLRDGKTLSTGSAGGTKFGVSSSEKMGFYGTAPITRPTGTPAAATDAATTQTLVNSLRTALLNLGLIQ